MARPVRIPRLSGWSTRYLGVLSCTASCLKLCRFRVSRICKAVGEMEYLDRGISKMESADPPTPASIGATLSIPYIVGRRERHNAKNAKGGTHALVTFLGFTEQETGRGGSIISECLAPFTFIHSAGRSIENARMYEPGTFFDTFSLAHSVLDECPFLA